jgi:uncharacterized protein YcbK (DUF882 family)
MSWKFDASKLPKPARMEDGLIVGNLKDGNPKLSPNFNANEFACPDCKVYKVSPTVLEGLQSIRDSAGAIRVAATTLDSSTNPLGSGYRCPTHNTRVGGARNSEHVRGIAADVSSTNMSVAQLYAICEQFPAFKNGGLGRYRWGVHVDTGAKRRWVG